MTEERSVMTRCVPSEKCEKKKNKKKKEKNKQ